MTTRLHCSLGHEWDPKATANRTCPKCGRTAEAPTEAATLAPSPAAAAATVALPAHSATQETGAPASGAKLHGGIQGFDLVRELGRGGMGVVYEARQIKLNRTVALKMILAGGHAGAAGLERFRTEAEAIARLQHPNIVQIYEVGEHDGLPFFALEFCGGGSLARRLAGTPLPATSAAALVEKLARAMHAAHQQGIIHRDLKPANILLAPTAAGGEGLGVRGIGTPKITDFGLAKKLDAAPGTSESDGLTATGSIMGTPSYMAPEQAGGKTHVIGAAADVYALGAILYECLTGRPPFKAASPLDTMLQVMSQEPVPPTRLNAQVPADLETIALKCLHKEPRKRYASASALAEDLRRVQAGEPIQARRVGRLERAWRWSRRNRAVAALLGAVAVLVAAVGVTVIVGGVAATFFAIRAGQEAELADKARRQAEDAAADARKERDHADRERDRAEWLAYAGRIALAKHEWKFGDGAVAWHHLDLCPVTMRGWEYDYLYTVFNSNHRTLRGHVGAVNGMAFRPDGKRLASAGSDQSIKIWDPEKMQVVASLWGHTGAVAAVAYSPDGKRLASASYDQTVRLWDADEGKLLLTLPGHRAAVTSVAFRPDGKQLTSAGLNGTVKIWDVQTGQLEPGLLTHNSRVNCVAYSPDGKHLASAGHDLAVKLWDVQTGHQLVRSFKCNDAVWCVAFSGDSKRLVANNQQLGVAVWDVATGETVGSVEVTTGGISAVAFAADGERLATGNSDNGLLVWDLAKKQVVFTLKGHRDAITQVVFSPTDQRLASSSRDGTVMVWDLKPPTEARTLRGHGRWVRCVCFSPDGKRLASGSQDKTVRVWDTETGALLQTLNAPADVDGVCYSHDGKCIASGSRDGVVRLWDAARGGLLRTLPGHAGAVFGVAFCPDGQHLISCGNDRTIRIWDWRRGGQVHLILGPPGAVHCVAVSPDGKRFAAGTDNGVVRIWDFASRSQLVRLEGHTGVVRSLAFSPDSQRLASASNDRTVRVWVADTGQPLFTLSGHTGPATAVAFGPDGQRLVTGSDDKTVRVWETTRGQEVLSLTGHTFLVNTVAFCPDGKRIASGSDDWFVKLWEADQSSAAADRSRALALYYAERLQWSEVKTALARAIELVPDDHFSWYQLGAVLAYLGDAAAYDIHRKAMLERFGDTQDPMRAERTVKVCLLLPAEADQRQRLEQLADLAVTRGENASIVRFFQLARGLAAYRQGDDQAVELWLGRSLAAKNATWNCSVPALAILAMSRARRGQAKEAHDSLTTARVLFEQQAPRPGSEAFRGLWFDYLQCQVLLAEAGG
jgi:WD40 repeat protein